MPEARVLIRDAYRVAGLIGKGETMDPEDGDYGLRSLNGMLDAWKSLPLYARQVLTYAATVGPGQSFTIGNGQASDTLGPCPAAIIGGFSRIGQTDYPFRLIDIEKYNAIPDKFQTSSYPSAVYYSPGAEVGTLYVFPALGGPVEMYVSITAPLNEVASLNSELDLPVGYRDAVVFSLGEVLCVGTAAPSQALALRAEVARNRIRRANVRVPNLTMPGSRINGSSLFPSQDLNYYSYGYGDYGYV